ncbi:hypothetical protein [Paenibacillus alvei]|nr:hypothetical protein [Paenibacillus alvei]
MDEVKWPMKHDVERRNIDENKVSIGSGVLSNYLQTDAIHP